MRILVDDSVVWILMISFLSIVQMTDAQFKFNIDLAKVPETGNYTCDEMVRWLGNEKHYSNDKKDVLFSFLVDKHCESQPTVQLKDVSFGWSPANKKTFFQNPKQSLKKCSTHDDFAVAWLSNFSINNNFSHFLHGILRLFCALVDARLIVWDEKTNKYIEPRKYTIWLDEWFRLTKDKESWLKSFQGATLRSLASTPGKGDCVSSSQLLYGSGCVRLLPPEKWFGYPGCRAGEVLPAFGQYMRQVYSAPQGAASLEFVDEQSSALPGLRVSFAVRDVGATTGMRIVSNLEQVQMQVKKTQHIHSSMENITFEHLDVPSTVRYMAGVHIFVSVHGAGMTNMFFMNRGSAVVEIIPYPLCNCRSPDYFYGSGGYYHGSAIAQGIKHYHYCVPAHEVKWHEKPKDLRSGAKCDWKALHAVESVYVDPSRFVSLMRNVERDLVAAGTIVLTKPIINVAPHANG